MAFIGLVKGVVLEQTDAMRSPAWAPRSSRSASARAEAGAVSRVEAGGIGRIHDAPEVLDRAVLRACVSEQHLVSRVWKVVGDKQGERLATT